MARRTAKAISSDEDDDEEEEEEDQASDGDFAASDVDHPVQPTKKFTTTARKSQLNVSSPSTLMTKTKKATTISTPPRPSRPSGGSIPDTVTRKRLSVVNRPSTLSSVNNSMGVIVGSAEGGGGGQTQQKVSREVMDNNFEEWMKLATDNVSAASVERRA